MRGATLLLLLTLVVPSVTSVLCEVNCAQVDRHAAAATAAAATGCHEQTAGSGGTAVAAAAGGACHDHGEAVTATLVERLTSMTATVLVQLPAALSVDGQFRTIPASGNSGDRPHIVPPTTQLRI